MNNFTQTVNNKVLSALNDYAMLSNTQKIIVGFSGGADSVCLLNVLKTLSKKLDFSVEAIHINHGIRGYEAQRDEDFAVSFCENNNIPIFVEHLDCITEAKNSKESLEECGRRLRYKAFSALCDGETKIATAHNSNDNAETVLFNLARGASVKGVCGIPPVRDNIIRPIIYCSREEIEGYCKENNLQYVTDSTNLLDDYSRNKIRHIIIPALEQINDATILNISNFCDNAKDVSEYIDIQAQNSLQEAIISEHTYDVLKLKSLHKAILGEVILKAYSCFSSKTLDRVKIKFIVNLISSGGRCQIYGDEFVEVVKDQLRFFHRIKDVDKEKIHIDCLNKYTLGRYSVEFSKFTDCSNIIERKVLDNLIDCDKINGKLFLRTREEGDVFQLYKRNVSKSLKKLFNEYSVPVEQRNLLPILCDDEGIVWIYSVGVCARCHITESSSNIICVKGENNG